MKGQSFNNLLDVIKTKLNLKKTLFINDSSFHLFDEFEEKSDLVIKRSQKGESKKVNLQMGDSFNILDKIENKYDLIIGNFPLLQEEVSFQEPLKGSVIKVRKDWGTILKSLSLLNKLGYGLFLVEPSFFRSVRGEKFVTKLNNLGFYINHRFSVVA